MVGWARSRGRRWGLVVPALALATFVLLGPVAGATTSGPAAVSSSQVHVPSSSSVLSSTVTWNGKDVSSASSPSSALSLDGGQTASVNFSFEEQSTSDVTNASLEVLYLGLVLTTSKAATSVVVPRVATADVNVGPFAAAGHINWSFGPLTDALEGVFELTASLLNANGSTAWSESFYVFAKAPYLLESGAVIVLLILMVAELFWGISSIRDARRGARPPQPGAPPPTGGSAPGPAPPPPPAGPGGSPEGASGAPASPASETNAGGGGTT